MKSHLAYISGEYEHSADINNVHPISVIDAEIIETLTDSIKPADDLLGALLEQYKLISDHKFLQKLEEYRDNNLDEMDEIFSKQGDGEDDQPKDFYRNFIQIKDEIFQVAAISRIQKKERYIDGRLMYSILINNKDDLNTTRTMIVDVFIDFFTPEQRESEMKSLKQKMIIHNKCKFI